MNFAILALVTAVGLIIAWNIYPPLRAKLRGWSTIIEGIIGTAFAYFRHLCRNPWNKGSEAVTYRKTS